LITPDPIQRIIELETSIAHLQHEVEQMHSVLLAVQVDLTKARELISKLERRVQAASEPQEEREPSLERPPHY
jgi:SlyX protein